MTLKFVPEDKFVGFVAAVTKGYEICGQETAEGEQPHMVRTEPSRIKLGGARAVEPIKSVIYPPRDDMGEYFGGEMPVVKTMALVGVTACDLRALEVLDEVFLGGDQKDPYYEERRKGLLVISMDCAGPQDVCFCTFFDQTPYPATGFDINITPFGGQDGYLVEAGTDKGEELLTNSGFTDATDEQIRRRNDQRKSVTELVDRQAKAAGLDCIDGISEKLLNSRGKEFWKKHADKCVECGACNFICPACHCFLLVDVEQRGKFRRFKNWDSCLLRSFAAVAGGHNPRARRVERLQNRFEKKFDFLINVIKHWGCTGCGRCTQACAGDIDIREVLNDVLHS